MKRIINFNIAFLFLSTAFFSCNKEYGSLNGPAVEDYLKNASKDQLNGLVTGSLSGMRINEGMYLDVVGVVGREMYRFSMLIRDMLPSCSGPAILPSTTPAFILPIHGHRDTAPSKIVMY